ncbi:MAG: alpha-ketoacid dehydrogenase subunit beta [Armatimonadota bacterium]|nr:alpha-ketoacid dehydrogenase subunit beta [Armatimonadota bacterium]MDR7448998.1 alpha-ketoacid dehydrogenase subunit beta [Armatimonadota bacterium]MDR7458624.1 alpha-ketoacid dehydrogenase subunit beta [Armatimonadota bacterium]MDR7479536.1 alpha-ketoacid dehydrogenase subunit beta [Armatimonadota bacterium]MDR7489064.1 alpha-ketoacid dehydrogenase subunit beta [Armatimonadota bacterium]
MPELRYVDALNQAHHEEMARDERVVVLGEDVGRKGGVFGVTMGLYERFGEDRVIDSPLAESSIAGVAIGMAANGLLPIAEFQFADFIHPAFNQIVSEAARMRYRSNNGYGCPVVFRAPYGGSHGTALYHSQSVEAFYAHVPGLKVVAPYTPADAKGMLKAAVRDPDPVLFLEHKRMYRIVRGEVPEGDYVVPLGPAAVRRQGRDLSVFAFGWMLHEALAAAEEVAAEGIEAEVVDLRCLRPLDRETILASVAKTSRALIVYEDNRFMGIGAEIAALIAEEAFESLDAPVMRLGGPDVPGIPFSKPLEEWFTIDRAKIAAAMRRLAAY